MGRYSKWDERFQRDAVNLVRSSGRARCRVAADLGVSDPTLVRWMEKYNDIDDGKAPLSETERAELLRLRSENKKLKDDKSVLVMEREILKKAEAFWVKESNE